MKELMSAFVFGKQSALSKQLDLNFDSQVEIVLFFQHQWQPIFIRPESRVSFGDCGECNRVNEHLCDILVTVICTIASDEKNKIIQLLEILYIFVETGKTIA